MTGAETGWRSYKCSPNDFEVLAFGESVALTDFLFYN